MQIDVWDYYGKDVKIVDIDGKTWVGYVSCVQGAPDYEPDEQDIELDIEGEPMGVSIMLSEIKSIEIINRGEEDHG